MWKRTKHLDKKYFKNITYCTKYNYLKSWKAKKSNFNTNYVAEFINDIVIPKNNLSVMGDIKSGQMYYNIYIDMDIARQHFNEIIGYFRGGGVISNIYDIRIMNETTFKGGNDYYTIEKVGDYYICRLSDTEIWWQLADSSTGFTELGHQICTIPMGTEVNEFSYASMIVPNPDLAIGTYVYDDFALQKINKYVFKVTVGSTVYQNAYFSDSVTTNRTTLNIPAVLKTREDNNLTVLSIYEVK